MELAGGNEGVNRIGKKKHVCFFNGFFCRSKILFQYPDPLSGVQNFKGVLRIFLFQIENSL